MKFKVQVDRISYATQVIEVEAKTVTEARKLALDTAGGLEFREHDADYEVDNVIPDLKKGDKVYWNDPDEGACSRFYLIKNITIRPDLVRIEDEDGSVLECPYEELELSDSEELP